MEEVYSCLVDTRRERPRLLAGALSSWLGPQVWRSDDLGETWQETPNGAIRFPEDTDAAVERVWQLAPGRRARRRVRRHRARRGLPVRPTAARPSTLERGLWDHPHRKEWGAGFGGQAFHTVLPHPDDPAVGDRRDLDRRGLPDRTTAATRGTPRNHGIQAEFLPEGQQYPEFGQCVHKVTRHPLEPDRLYAPEPRRRLPLRRRRRPRGSPSPTGCPADFGFPIVVAPPRARHRLRLPDRRGGDRFPPEGQAAGLALARRRRALGAELGEGLPDAVLRRA